MQEERTERGTEVDIKKRKDEAEGTSDDDILFFSHGRMPAMS